MSNPFEIEEYIPVTKRFPDLMADLDESINDSVSGMGDEAATFYALSITNISQLRPRISDPSWVKTLKVIHCNTLVSAEGLEEYEALEHLDLSSNQLAEFNIMTMPELIYLNLSWNAIKIAPNLKNLRELITLDLSHNRIEDLSPFEPLSEKKNSLKEINLNDNMITDLHQIAYLSKFKHLTKVHFKDKKRNTDNPICELSGYLHTVWTYLPNLTELDGGKIVIKEQENLSENQTKFIPKPTTYEPAEKHVSFQGGEMFDLKETSWLDTPQRNVTKAHKSNYESPFDKGPSISALKIPLKLTEKDSLIQKLYNELCSAKEYIADLESDKKEAIGQIENNQRHNEKIIENLRMELNKRSEFLKENNREKKEIEYQLEIYEKKVKSLQDERDRYKDLREDKDDTIHHLNKEIIKYKNLYEEEQDRLGLANKDLKYYKDKYTELTEEKGVMKDTNQQLETKVTQLQNEILENNREAARNWEGLQQKYQQSLAKLEHHSDTIQALQSRVAELKDINKQMDAEWTRKYTTEVSQKEKYFIQLKQEKEQTIETLKKEKEDSIVELKAQMQKDVVLMDKSFTKQLSDEKAKNKELQSVVSDLSNKLKELKDVLKLTSQNMSKKDIMISELRDIVNSSNKKILLEKEEIKKEKGEIESYKNKIDELTYKNKDLIKKLELTQSFLDEKSNEYDLTVKQSFENKKKMVQIQNELESIKSHYEDQIDTYSKEIDKLKENWDEFEHLLRTKEKMLDDQNDVINRLKDTIKDKDKEILALQEDRENDTQKIYFEGKLEEAYNDNELLKKEIKELEKQLQINDEEYQGLVQDYEKLRDSEEAATKEAADHKATLTIIKDEFLEIKDEITSRDNKITQQKNEAAELKNIIQEMSETIKKKNKELAAILQKYEEYRSKKDSEVEKISKELKLAIKENQCLVTENDKQKRFAELKIKELSSYFNS